MILEIPASYQAGCLKTENKQCQLVNAAIQLNMRGEIYEL